MVQGGGVVTVMTSSGNMSLFLEFSIVEYTKACKVSGVVYAVCVCVFTDECFYAGFLTLGAHAQRGLL